MLNAVQENDLLEELEKFGKEIEKSRPTFKFSRNYMRFVSWIFLSIRATREGNWYLHIESLKGLCKYLFAHDRLNYARMVPLYLAQMDKLKTSDPDIHQEFLEGNFCVQKSEVPFTAIGPDHGIEHVNRETKVSGGLKGLTQQPSPMARCFFIAHELSRLASETEGLTGASHKSRTHHHDLSQSILDRFEQNVSKLKEVLKRNDPFLVTENELVNVITKAIMPEEVKQSLSQPDKTGEDLFAKFVDERLVGGKISVWSPMKKVNLKTWKTARKTKTNPSTANITALKADRALFARFLVVTLSRPEIILKESIGTFEYAVFPRSVYTLDGSLRSSVNKSKLMSLLEGLVRGDSSSTKDTQRNSCKRVQIIDGMAVVQLMGKPAWVRTVQHLGDHFVNVIESKSINSQEVHVVFYRYDFDKSLKEKTRQTRQKNRRSVAYDISDDAVIEKVSLQELLSNQGNKQKLTVYLAGHLLKRKEHSPITYVTTTELESCKSNKLSLEHLQSSHEEADTKIFLHALDATKRGASSIYIESPDTDVLVLAVWCYPELCTNTTMMMGTNKNRRVVDIGAIYSALGDKKASALPAFHVLSGCNQTGSLCSKSKLSWWNALHKADDEIIEALGRLGNETTVMDSDLKVLERFICLLYSSDTTISSVGEMRWHLFRKCQYTDQKLPPTVAALLQKIRRANYVSHIWNQCGIPRPSVPDPTSHGWYLEDNRLISVPTLLKPAPQAVLELVRCRCKTHCVTQNCSCKKHNLNCTDACFACGEACQNRNVTTDITSIENDDSDNEDLDL